MNKILKKSMKLGSETFTLETGKLARLASGSVLGRTGDSVVLVAASVAKEKREGANFFPLTVDIEEKMYAAGKIPGGFIKREGRPTEKSILTARLIDRPIRPLFPNGFMNDIQIIATILSVDDENEVDIIAMNCASAALNLSSAPFNGPIGAVRVGLVNNQFIINPNKSDREQSKINLTVAGTKDAVMMVEGGADIVSEDTMLEAILLAHEEIKKIAEFISDFRSEAIDLGIAREKIVFEAPQMDQVFLNQVSIFLQPKMDECIENILKEDYRKEKRDEVFSNLKKKSMEEFFRDKEDILNERPEVKSWYKEIYSNIEKESIRDLMLNKEIRIDNRRLDEVRPITCEVDILPRTHGSALFTRGETQILSVVTLGSSSDEQMIDDVNSSPSKRYMHQYNFPPYSVGETRPMRGPGRREIGHGNLAERALIPVIPNQEDCPYIIRVVSEALSSNGSTSMGSVCGSSLSLMAAGIKTKATVSGIAMGLIKKGDKVKVLTDIQGLEDHLGDMDFKVTGTSEGVTALQMDIKCDGINKEILKSALEQAKKGRLHIMEIMNEALSKGREEVSEFAPRITTMVVHPDKIREIIGQGGKVIKKIIEDTGVEININDEGIVQIAGVGEEKIQHAKDIINLICAEVKVGNTYNGKVMRIMDFGAFVEVIPGYNGGNGKEGLVHISELDIKRVNKVEDILSVGDKIIVKAISIDNLGRLKLSRKAVIEEENE